MAIACAFFKDQLKHVPYSQKFWWRKNLASGQKSILAIKILANEQSYG